MSAAQPSPTAPPSPHLCNELLLKIFAELTLPSLIVARGVSRKWRTLISCADIVPARQVLLDFYLLTISSPTFLAQRQNCSAVADADLDPVTYLERLTNRLVAEGHRLPDEIKYWILEWPRVAALPWVWPSYPPESVALSRSGSAQTPNSTVVDDPTRPLIATRYFADSWTSQDTGIPMMELSSDSVSSGYWIALGDAGDMAEVGGRVYLCAGTEILDQAAPSWVEWLKGRLEKEDARCWTP